MHAKICDIGNEIVIPIMNLLTNGLIEGNEIIGKRIGKT